MDVLTLLVLLFAVINIIFIPVSFYICWDKGGQFSFIERPLSYVSETKIKVFYSVSLVLIAVFEVLFISGLFFIFPETQTVLALSLFYSGMISLALSGIVTSEMNKLLHRLFAQYMVVSMTIWTYVFSSYFISISAQVGYGGLIIAITASLGTPLLYLKTKGYGLSELLFAALTVFWNILFVYLLFNFN